MITTEDISSLNDNETTNEELLKIKELSKTDIKLAKKIRIFKKISYLTKNTMAAYKNKLTFDISKKIILKFFILN